MYFEMQNAFQNAQKIYFYPEKNMKAYTCLKFSDPLPETHLFFYLASVCVLVSLPNGSRSWSMICVYGISWSHSLLLDVSHVLRKVKDKRASRTGCFTNFMNLHDTAKLV